MRGLALLLLCPGLLSADVIRAEFVEVGRPHTTGWVSILFEEPDPQKVYLEAAGAHNFGLFSRDEDPTGWVDANALQWDVTADGVGGEIAIGLPVKDPGVTFPDSLRIVNDGVESYVAYDAPQFRRRLEVQWNNVAVDVPEPEVWLLLSVIFVWLFAGCLHWRSQ